MIILVLLLIWFLGMLSEWRVFQKMGFNGWKSLIPLYHDFLLFKGTYGNGWRALTLWLAPAGGMVLGTIFAGIGAAVARNSSGAGPVVLAILGSLCMMAGLVAAVVIEILLYFKLAQMFNKPKSFGVGLVLVTPVFMLLLGLSDEKYCDGSVSIKEGDVISGCAYRLENYLTTHLNGSHALSELKDLSDLHQAGVVDDALFEAKKAELMARL